MLGIAALVTAALFSGAAVYVLVAEHPARRHLEPVAQLTQWKPSYARGAIMQASLAALSGLLGVGEGIVSLRGGAAGLALPWFIGGALMLSAIAYTFAVIWGLNGRLKATPIDQASTETVAMLDRWARLHLGRTLLGLGGLLAYAVALDQLVGFMTT